MTFSPLFRPRATLAAALLAGVSFAWHSSQDVAREERGWSVTRSGTESVALAPSPGLFRADGSVAGESVRYEATVQPPLPGRYRLHVSAENLAVNMQLGDTDGGEDAPSFEVWHDDQFGPKRVPERHEFVTEWFETDGSPFEMSIAWTTLADGAVRGRVLWEREFDEGGGFPPEPISSRALVAFEGTAGTRVEYEALLEKKGCWNCHPSDELEEHGVQVQRRAPVLDHAAQRAGTAWIRDWLTDPAAVQPHADMPRVLFGTPEEVEREATALARFLASVAEAPAPSSAATEPEVLRRGRDLYHAVGCVACHGALVSPAELLDDPYSPNELPAETPLRPFGAIAGKWRPAALSAFLRDPLESYPDGRMPSLNLSEEEADAIANYLSAHFGPARDLEGAATEEELALGRKLFVARDCGGCHGLESAGLTLLPAAVPFAGLDASKACLSESVEGAKSPRYDLDAATRAALVGFIANELPKTSADEGLPSHELARAFERHACRACHIVDSAGGPPDDAKVYFWTAEEETDLGDEGRFPPNLSGVGHKLTTSWMREVLTNAGTARPYMATRMPQFGSDHLDGLAELFAAQEGLRPDSDVAPPVMNDELVMTGRELMGLDKMACVTCHVYKDFPPLSTDGPDMTAFAERLRYEWWRGYIHDPQRYKPGTRMPTFGTGNVSSFKDVLDGDLTRQADALWAYMNLGDFMPVPEGLEADSEMIIAVGDRPVVMRAFLPEVGARGIAVGNPNGLHYAYDAERARLVHAWTGEFLDAAGSWAGRGGSENDELGDVVWRALPGPAIWLNTDFSQQATPEFRGYALDRDGSPVFYSDLDGVRIEEQIITSMQPERTIRRHFRLTGLSGREMVFVRVATDATRMVEVAGGNAMQWGELVDAQTFEPVEDLPGMTWAIELDADTDQLAFVMVEDVQ